MRRLVLLVIAACGSTTPFAKPEVRPLGMNDVTLLLPLPAALDQPTLITIAGDQTLLVARGLVASLVFGPGDIGPKNELPVAYEDFHVVAIRFDLCDRAVAGTCPDGDDGRLRIVLQPLYRANGATLAHDIALHAFYPIPAGELAAVVGELRAIAAARDLPLDAPLDASPPLEPGVAARLRALVTSYARWDRVARLTVIGQDKRSAAFAWVFRGFDRQADDFTSIPIPEIGATRQGVLVAGGDTIYTVDPVADAPRGFAIALNGAMFAAATPADRLTAVEALTAIQNPALHDANDLQCVGCHVSTLLTAKRAQAAGLDPAAIAGRFTSPYNLRVDTIAATDPRVVRALGWASSFPAISQRVANDTAHVLTEIEARYPDP